MEDNLYLLISPLLEAYAENHTTPEPDILARLSRETHLRTSAPQMLSGHLQGMLLRMISFMLKPERILEIGTFTGYSAICLAQGLSATGVLHTIEINPELHDFAANYFSQAGLADRIVMHTGHALDILHTISGPFDLSFIDADKDQYIPYFDLVLEKTRPGGWIIADNTLWYGRVLDKNSGHDRETAGIIAFNEYLQSHPGVENLLLPVRDGLMISRKLVPAS
jgi:predicted O-methyltransferase YrrM